MVFIRLITDPMKQPRTEITTHITRQHIPSSLDRIFAGASSVTLGVYISPVIRQETQDIIEYAKPVLQDNFDLTYIAGATTLLVTGITMGLTYAFMVKASANLRGNYVETARQNIPPVKPTETPQPVNTVQDDIKRIENIAADLHQMAKLQK